MYIRIERHNLKSTVKICETTARVNVRTAKFSRKIITNLR